MRLPSEKLVLDRATPSDVALRASTVGYLAFLAFAWGGNYAWTKLALADSGPWAFNALRYLCASIVLGAILLARGREFSVLPLRGERLPLAVIGLLQIAIMTGASTLALTMIEASRTVLIAYSMPIWGMLLSIAILRERVTARVFAGVVLGFAGLAFLCAPWSMDWTSPAALLGSTLALGGTLGWALASVLYRRRSWRSDFWSQTFGQFLAATAVMVPAALLFEDRSVRLTATFGGVLAWNVLAATIVAFYCWARALDRMSVVRASQFLLLSPVFGVLLSAAVLGEPLTPALLVSGGLIIAGAVLSSARPASAEPTSTDRSR